MCFSKFIKSCLLSGLLLGLINQPAVAVGNRVLGGQNIFSNDSISLNFKSQLLADEVIYWKKRNLFTDNGNGLGFDNGASLRDATVYFYGNFHTNIKYALGIQFLPNMYAKYDKNYLITDAYVQFVLPKGFNLYFGNFQNFYGMNTLTNITDRFFLESDISTIAFEPLYGLGAALTFAYADRFTAGIAATTPDPNFKDKTLRLLNFNSTSNDPVMLSGRLTFLPWKACCDQIFHIGAHGYTYRTQYLFDADGNRQGYDFYNQDVANADNTSGYGIFTFLYPEAASRQGFNNSLYFSNSAISLVYPKRVMSGGLEAALLVDKLAIQAEYNWFKFNQFVDPNTNTNFDYHSDGGYAQIEYVAFGGKRDYLYDFGLIGPIKTDGNYNGALSFDLRVSYLNMRDKNFRDFGKGINYTYGLNYLFNDHISVKLNYITSRVWYQAFPTSRIKILGLRFQAVF